MRHDHCWRTRYSFVVIIAATALILVLRASAATQTVTIRDDQIQKDNTLNSSDADASTADLRTVDGSTAFVHSKTFVPPSGWGFMKFPHSNTHVDIALGTVSGLSPMRWTDTDSAIEVRATYPKPANSGTFPLQCEGNLKPNGGGGGGAGGQPPQKHWAAKIKDEEEQRLRILPPSDPFIFKSNRQITLIVRALSESGEPEKDVHVKLNAATDVGQLAGNPFTQGDTEYDLILGPPPNGPPPEYLFDGQLATPQPNATKYTITATANGYQDDQIELPIVSAQWVQRDKYQGFDGTTSPPWLVVGAGQTSTGAKLQLDQGVTNVKISISDATKATIQPDQAGGAMTNTDVTGVQAASKVFAKATLNTVNGAIITRLNIEVKKFKIWKVKYVFVKDSHGHDGTLPNLTMQAIFDKCKAVWGDQAAIDLQIAPGGLTTTWNYPDDLTATPQAATMVQRVFENNSTAPQPSNPNEIYVYIIPNLQFGVPNVSAETTNDHRATFIRSDAATAKYAHELGHAFGCLAHSEHKGDLMYSSPDEDDFVVHKRIADLVNP